MQRRQQWAARHVERSRHHDPQLTSGTAPSPPQRTLDGHPLERSQALQPGQQLVRVRRRQPDRVRDVPSREPELAVEATEGEHRLLPGTEAAPRQPRATRVVAGPGSGLFIEGRRARRGRCVGFVDRTQPHRQRGGHPRQAGEGLRPRQVTLPGSVLRLTCHACSLRSILSTSSRNVTRNVSGALGMTLG